MLLFGATLPISAGIFCHIHLSLSEKKLLIDFGVGFLDQTWKSIRVAGLEPMISRYRADHMNQYDQDCLIWSQMK